MTKPTWCPCCGIGDGHGLPRVADIGIEQARREVKVASYLILGAVVAIQLLRYYL